jgi:3-oxoadipate enol-lactonase
VFYEVTGDGLPVLLIHGGFMDSRMWDKQVPELSKSFKVIRFDIRGFGKSSRPGKEFYPGKEVAQLLDHLKVPKAAVVGLSMGGSVAIDFALSYPEKVHALILAEPGVAGHKWSNEVMGEMKAMTSAFQSGGREAAIEVLLKASAFRNAAKNPAVFQNVKRQVNDNFNPAMPPMRSNFPDAIQRLTKINAPTLLLVSEHAGPDALVIKTEIEKQVKQAKIVTVQGAGHMMNMEQPAQFNKIIVDFLKSAVKNQNPLRPSVRIPFPTSCRHRGFAA